MKWSPCSHAIETIPLEQKYLCLCFDAGDDCYWAVPACTPGRVCRLDLCFRELGCFKIDGAERQRATGVCCDGCGTGLWLAYPRQLALWDKCTEKVSWGPEERGEKFYLGVAAQHGCLSVGYSACGRQIISAQSPCDGACIELCVPEGYLLVGMAPCPCEPGACRFCALLSEGCSGGLVLMEYCVDFAGRHDGGCCCHPCPPPPPPPPPPVPPCGGSYEIMHSIALEEAGISHILNAEGEKIQKAVAISDSIEELLCVNDSVKKTLTQVTLLEGMLYSKLEALVGCDCCRKPEPPCPPPCPPPCGGDCHGPCGC